MRLRSHVKDRHREDVLGVAGPRRHELAGIQVKDAGRMVSVPRGKKDPVALPAAADVNAAHERRVVAPDDAEEPRNQRPSQPSLVLLAVRICEKPAIVGSSFLFLTFLV